MGATWVEGQPFSSRARFDRALLASILAHALFLMLQFGITGFGLPGLSSPLAETLSLTVRLAELPAAIPKVATRKIREQKLPPAAPKEKAPEEKPVTSIEPPEISAEVTPPAPPEKTEEKPVSEPLESAPVVAAPAPVEQAPQEREIILSSPNENSFVMPPPAPEEEQPQPQVSVAENQKDVPKPEPAPVQEAKTEEQPAPQQEAKKEEEPARPQQAGSEQQATEPDTGRQADEGSHDQAQAPAGTPDIQGGQPEGVSGQEQGKRLALELEVLRLPKFEETRPKPPEQPPREEPKPPEPSPPPAPVVREPTQTVVPPEKPKEVQAPVEEVEIKTVKRKPPPLACEEAEGRFLQGRELEHSGDLKGSFVAYRESADCGYGLAQRKLGDLYGTGNEVVLRNYEISLRWYRKAREQGIEIPNMARRLRSY